MTTPRLPADLVQPFFRTLLNDFQNHKTEYLNCLTLCRQWHDLGIPILYRDLVIREANVRTLTDYLTADNDQKHCKYVQSLTVYDQFQYWKYAMFDIQCLLPYLEKLVSLSVHFRTMLDDGLDFTNAITNLPSHVHFFEVRVAEDVRCDPEDGCACDGVARLASTVRVFRYYGCFCSMFFRTLCDSTHELPFRSISINNIRGGNLYLEGSQALDESYGMVSDGQSLLNSGRLPQIKHFAIYSVVLQGPISGQSTGIILRDLLRKRTTVYPLIHYPLIYASPNSWIRIQQSPSHKLIEKCATMSRITDASEAEGWVVTSFGAAVPLELAEKAVRMRCDYHYSQKLDLVQLPDTCMTWREAPELWKWEQEAGRLLLLPQFYDDIRQLDALKRDICEAERKGTRLSDYAMTCEVPHDHVEGDTSDESWMSGSSGNNTSSFYATPSETRIRAHDQN